MPRGKRKYLPYGLTKRERRSPVMLKRLSRCIKAVEKKSCPRSALRKDGTYNYRRCAVNPVSICRSSVEKKKSRKRKRK